MQNKTNKTLLNLKFLAKLKIRSSADGSRGLPLHLDICRFRCPSILSLAMAALLFAGCGYKPQSYFAQKSLGEKLFVQTEVMLKDPENSVIIKDAMKEAAASKFGMRLVSSDKAETMLFLKVTDVGFTPTDYDKNGFVVQYRVSVFLTCEVYKSGKLADTLKTRGSYDFAIAPNTTISDASRFGAIKNGADKALDQLTAKLAYLGAKSD